VQQYAVVVPVKPPARGKSRLAGLDDDRRRELAAAFALDTVAACLATPRVARVLVATDDAGFATRLSGLGASVVPDGDGRGLNPVLRQAAAEAGRRWPDLVPVALCADLPTLRADDLEAALGAASDLGGEPAYVADHTGLGTTTYVAPVARFAPAFGPGSAQAHRRGGAVSLPGVLRTLRLDVDDLDDLDAAAVEGLGPATAAVWPPAR